MSAGTQRASATFWLLDAPDSLSVQSHREPDGTGLGWFDADGHARLSKQPIAAYGDADFASSAHEVASRTFVAHIRFASTGKLAPENTHPFEQDGRLFAHNGVIEDLDLLDTRLGSSRDLVHGETDSERLFALITSEIAAQDGDVSGAITTACSWVAANLPVFAINLVLVTADDLWALRYPETHPLYVLERRAGKALEHSSSFGSRVVSDQGAHQPLVTVASERMDDDPGWRPMRSGELIRVSPELEVSSQIVLTAPPVRPLTLADLNTRARASQAKAPAV